MDNSFKLNCENPYASANFVSRMLFLWIAKIVNKMKRKDIEMKDLYKTLDYDSSEYLGDKLEQNWNLERILAKEKNTKPSLLKTILSTFIWKYLLCAFLAALLHVIVRPLQAILLGFFIAAFDERDAVQRNVELYKFGAAIILATIFGAYLVHIVNYHTSLVGLRVKVAISSLIYRKMLRMSKTCLTRSTQTEIIDLLSNDMIQFDFLILSLCYIAVTPPQILLIGYLMWRNFGVSSAVGIGVVIIITLPVQGLVFKLTRRLWSKLVQLTDSRVKMMNEIFSGLQVVKVYVWEDAFEQIIHLIRNNELKISNKIQFLKTTQWSISHSIDKIGIFITIISFILLGNYLKAEDVFPMILYYNALKLTLGFYFSSAINTTSDVLVSIDRIRRFLLLDTKETLQIEEQRNSEVILINVKACWETDLPVLQNINVNLAPGSFCIVTGPPRCGKSSLLQLLLGELRNVQGLMKMDGNISYCSQEPWLFPASLRKNILFGQEYSKSHYKKIVDICRLKQDFEKFEEGDRSIVGQNGFSLSDDLKIRINLARALYKDADIYLFDDIFATIERQIGLELFENIFMEHLKEKTKILVSLKENFTRRADIILIMKNGTIDAQGTYDDLSKSYLDFPNLFETEEDEKILRHRKLQHNFLKQQLSIVEDFDQSLDIKEFLESKQTFTMSPIKEYLHLAGSACKIMLFLLLCVIGQILQSGTDVLLTYWINLDYEITTWTATISKNTITVEGTVQENKILKKIYPKSANIWDEDIIRSVNQHLSQYDALHIYIGIILFIFVIIFVRSVIFCNMTHRASKSLHEDMLYSVIRAPMKFFDTNPIKRILDRFSKDICLVDRDLPVNLFETIMVNLHVLGVSLVLIMSNEYAIIVILLFIFLFYVVMKCYIRTTRNLRQIEGKTQSPILSHVNSSISGIITIRACQAEEKIIEEFDDHQNVHTSVCILMTAFAEYFGLLLDLMCAFLLVYISISFIILQNYAEINKSVVGLCLSLCISLIGTFQFGTKSMIETVKQLSNTERVIEYAKLSTEGPFETPNEKWKHIRGNGRIQFHNLHLQYSPSSLNVLKDLNVTFEAGLKVGIIGRPGSGKSSLVNAIFGITPHEGTILIDGIDTNNLGLSDLRKMISLVPKDPTLFTDTVRKNLDPYGEYDDLKLWRVLDEVQLKDMVPSLDFTISQGGINFNTGQRQLFCLARALLRNNNILILDEATANVDSRTELIMQRIIKKNEENKTVITIANKINTVIECDKVMVMDNGKIIEFDHPHILLRNHKSYLSKMVIETGPVAGFHLKQLARESYEKKNIRWQKNYILKSYSFH